MTRYGVLARAILGLILTLATPAWLVGFVGGPLPSLTGGFGEPTCRACHFDAPLNAEPGRLALEGVPPSYTPGGQYVITVRITRDGMQRGGFELSARFASGPQSGDQAGVLHARDARVRLVPGPVPDGKIQYAIHTQQGTAPVEASALAWTIEWEAPPAGGPVVFHAAANAANDDASPLGDFIYTTEVRATPGR